MRTEGRFNYTSVAFALPFFAVGVSQERRYSVFGLFEACSGFREFWGDVREANGVSAVNEASGPD